MRSVRFFLSFLAVISIGASTLEAQVSGVISADTTWTLASSPVTVGGSITVPAGVTLTIEAGTVVAFSPGTGLLVEGKLIAQGTVTDTIVFTSAAGSPARGNWDGIEFANTSNVGSVVQYVKVEWVGGGPNQAGIFYRTGAYGIALSHLLIRESSHEGVNLRASYPDITDSRFENMDGFGVFSDLFSNFSLQRSVVTNCVEGGVRVPLNASPVIDSCTIVNNGDGIYVDVGAAPTITWNLIQNNINGIYYRSIGVSQPSLRDNTIQGNTSRGIRYDGSTNLNARYNYWGNNYGPYSETVNPTGRGDTVSNKVTVSPWKPSDSLTVTEVTASIASNTTWTAGVYWIKNTITVNGGVTLTLRPGAILKFNPSVILYINGSLLIQGNYDSLIVFTSAKDDSYGGDSNGDGEATQPAVSDWGYVNISGSWSAAYVILKYSNLGFYTGVNSSVNNMYGSSNEYALYSFTGNATSISVDNSLFGGNTNTGVWINGANGTTVNVNRSSFNGNTNYGLYLSDGTIVSFDSSKAALNGVHGVRGYQDNSTAASSFTASEFSNNGQHGLLYGSKRGSAITVDGNAFAGNGGDGLVVTKASILNNTFTQNRTGIVLQGDVGSTYSGNTFTGNSYNKSVGLRNDLVNLRGNLTTSTPAGLNTAVYLLMASSTVAAADTLTIDPNVVVKMRSGLYLSVNGTLLAQGSSGSPIVFTSYRDHTVGGNINVLGDTSNAQRGDWSYLQFGGTQRSILNYVRVHYAAYSIYSPSATWQNPITNFTATHASSYGVYFESGSSITIENSTFRYNGYGLLSSNMELILRNTEVSDNSIYGLYTPSGVGPKEISNSKFERNGSSGVYAQDVTGPMTMVGNIISSNGDRGVWYQNTTAPRTDVQFIGNTVSNNVQEGIVSSRARFVDNTFTGNKYALGATGYMGNLYTDNTNVDGNIFSGNTNPAISIRDAVGDTLKYLFPVGLPSHTYVVSIGLGSYASSPLIVQPGVVVKFTPNGYITRSKRLEAIGTASQPIVFTSWRDASHGGKTNVPSDTLGPNPGDWPYLQLNSNSGAENSRLEHVTIRYASYALYVTSVPLVNPIRNVRVARNSSYGLIFSGSTAALDSVTADSSNYGIYAGSNSTLAVTNSLFRGNAAAGLYADGGSEYQHVTNSVISNNGTGIKTDLANAPQVFQDNLIQNNSQYGIFALAENAAIDTLIMVNGNTLANNGIGLTSSRAYLIDNVFQQNQYPIGLSGQLSRAGTGNQLGNFYFGNNFLQNAFNVIRLIGNFNGVLGGTAPDSLPGRVFALFESPTVASGTELRIKPGTIIKALNGPVIRIDGTLIVEGTTAQRVVMTSWKDDTYGGDSNRDSSATLPVTGDFTYIRLLNTNSATVHSIASLNLRYSSYGISVENVNQVMIDSSLFANNTYGLYRPGTGTTTVTNSEFRQNNTGLYNTSGGTVTISGTNFSDHSGSAINQAFNSTITAANNYWGAATGPLVTNGPDLNPGGTGDRIIVSTGTVNYRPFYTGRSGVLAGDVSQNGQITAFDASLILQHLVASITLDGLQQAAADVTVDGSVSPLDASLILRYVVGYISGFKSLPALPSKNAVAPSYLVRTSPTGQDNEVDLIVSVRGDGIYGSQMSVSFSESKWALVSVSKTTLSDAFLIAQSSSGGIVKVALAGAEAPKEDGDWVSVRFRSLEEGASASDIQLKQFIFNEAGIATSTETEDAVIPAFFALGQNFPNPFNPSTTVTYDVPVPSVVTLKVYDVLGRQVATLYDGQQTAGVFNVQWNGAGDNGSRATSGVYFVAMSAQAQDGQMFRSVRKMVLTK